MIALRAITQEDSEAVDALSGPEITGPWDRFDDPAEEQINEATYDDGARVVIEDTMIVGTVSYIKVPYGPNTRRMAFKIGGDLACVSWS